MKDCVIGNGLEDWTIGLALDDADWKEAEHPREEDGKFGSKGGGSSAGEEPKKLTPGQKSWQTKLAKKAATAAQPEPKKKIDYTAKKLGGQKGSNPGGMYEGSDGVKRYVKFYKNMAQGRVEATSNTLYNDLGLGAKKSDIFEQDGQEAFASEMIEGGHILKDEGLTKENAQAVLKGFAADVLMANWDSVVLGLDNILMKDGKAYRIDNGATFTHRAMASSPPKSEGLLNKITEWDGLFDPSINPDFSRVAKTAGYKSPSDIPDIKAQVDKIVKLRDDNGGWHKYLKKQAPYLIDQEHEQYAAMLESRTKLLKDKTQPLVAAA